MTISPKLSQVIEYMRANINTALNLSDIAGVTSLSASHVTRMFRKELGMPPHQYLIGLRICKAQRMLEESDISIAEIAYDCGFANQEHLTRLFRRQCGTTPAAYRRAKRARYLVDGVVRLA